MKKKIILILTSLTLLAVMTGCRFTPSLKEQRDIGTANTNTPQSPTTPPTIAANVINNVINQDGLADALSKMYTGTEDVAERTITLENDITLDDTWKPLGIPNNNNNNPTVTPFNGILNGNHKTVTINNVSIDRPTEDLDLAGALFLTIGGNGEVKDLIIKLNHAVEGNGGEGTGDTGVGALAGVNKGTIRNVKIEGVGVGGSVKGKDRSARVNSNNIFSSYRIGGLVGVNDGTIENCEVEDIDVIGDTESVSVGGLVGLNNGTIRRSSYATGNVKGKQAVGGLVGQNDGTIENSYATGNVKGNKQVGGFVGWNNGTSDGTINGTIKNSYATGKVEGIEHTSLGLTILPSNLGGLVGENDGEDIEFSYYDRDTTEQRSHTNDENTKKRRGYGVEKAANIKKGNGDEYSAEYEVITLAGGTRLTQDKIFIGWDFTNIWDGGSGRWPIHYSRPPQTGASSP